MQRENNRCIQFRDLVISYVELEDRLKAMGKNIKNISMKDLEKYQNTFKRSL